MSIKNKTVFVVNATADDRAAGTVIVTVRVSTDQVFQNAHNLLLLIGTYCNSRHHDERFQRTRVSCHDSNCASKHNLHAAMTLLLPLAWRKL